MKPINNYKLTPEADNDLTEIWQYGYEQWGLKQANSYLLALETCFEQLFELPNIGTKCDEIVVGYRSYTKASHIIYYRMNNKKIEIIRILHRRMKESLHFH